jgi:putative ATPase
LRQQAERLPELERPIVLVGEPGELGELLTLRGEEDLRFDAIVSRNALGPLPAKADVLRQLVDRLQPGGRLSLAETVTSHSQRLYNLVDLSSLGDDLSMRVAAAEEQIYDQEEDPLVNWEAQDLKGILEAAGLEELVVQEDVQHTEALITPVILHRWFTVETDRERPSYAQHLLRRLTIDELGEVETLFQRQLAGQTITWQTQIAFLIGRRAG